MAGYDDLKQYLDGGRADPDADPGASPFDVPGAVADQHHLAVAQLLNRRPVRFDQADDSYPNGPTGLSFMQQGEQRNALDNILPAPRPDAPVSAKGGGPMSLDARNDLDIELNPHRHHGSAWLGPAIAASHAAEASNGPAPEGAPVGRQADIPPAGRPVDPKIAAYLKHDQRISAAPATPAFKTPEKPQGDVVVDDSAARAQAAAQAQRQAQQLNFQQGLASMHANESHTGALLKNAADIMTGGNAIKAGGGEIYQRGEEAARQPVQDAVAAQAKARQDELDQKEAHDKLVDRAMRQRLMQNTEAGEKRKEAQDANRLAEERRHNVANEGLERGKIDVLRDKADGKGGPKLKELNAGDVEKLTSYQSALKNLDPLAKEYHDATGFGPTGGQYAAHAHQAGEALAVAGNPSAKGNVQAYERAEGELPGRLTPNYKGDKMFADKRAQLHGDYKALVQNLAKSGYDVSRYDPNEFEQPQAASAPQAAAAPQVGTNAHPQDSAAIAWAKDNPSDPRAADILKANGA